ncbi:MAG: carboxypeptidase M32 [Cyanobacteria bacterium]|nr:carboxypeptidase M32 [Cyanobacteriota bacterium]
MHVVPIQTIQQTYCSESRAHRPGFTSKGNEPVESERFVPGPFRLGSFNSQDFARILFAGGKAAHPQRTIQALKTRAAEIQALEQVYQLLIWDTETAMPKAAANARAHQLVSQAVVLHQKQTHAGLGELLMRLQQPEVLTTLAPLDQALVMGMSQRFQALKRIPLTLVKSLAAATAETHFAWVQAREINDPSLFLPSLERLVTLEREKALRLSSGQLEPYQTLLSIYEPGLTISQLESIYSTLKPKLQQLLLRIQASEAFKKQNPDGVPAPRLLVQKGAFPWPKQWALGATVLQAMGFDPRRGSLGRSIHPFYASVSGPDDVRITTRGDENSLAESLYSIFHEGGHGLYDQGIPRTLLSPLGKATSLGMHEGQALLWENWVGKAQGTWEFLTDMLKKIFPGVFAPTAAETLYKEINQVRPSALRTEADEVTYNLHLMMRYELERDMINGKLAVKDLPAAWNAKSKAYLGIDPKNPNEGFLQDIHWSAGMFGYFPTYTMGTLYAAQLFEAAKKQIPDLEIELSIGNFQPLKQWLNQQVHQTAALESPLNMIQRISGESFSPEHYMRYLEHKYAGLYGLH